METEKKPLYGGKYPGWAGDESSGVPEEELYTKLPRLRESSLEHARRKRRKLTEAQREILQNA